MIRSFLIDIDGLIRRQSSRTPWKMLCGVMVLLVIAVAMLFPAANVSGSHDTPLRPSRIDRQDLIPPEYGVTAIVRDPGNSSRMFAAGRSGFFRSVDGGASWQTVRIYGSEGEAFAVAVGGVSGQLLVVGRRDGLWKSEDGGGRWTPLRLPGGSIPLAAAIAPSDPRAIYVATARDGLFKSTDRGQSWVGANHGLPEAPGGGRIAEIRHLAVNPGNPDVAVAVSSDPIDISLTRDGGSSWVSFTAALPLPLLSIFGHPRVLFDSNPPFHLYVALSFRPTSALIMTRLFVLADTRGWLPVPGDVPVNLRVRDLDVDRGQRQLRLWTDDGVVEVPLLDQAVKP
jgi:hypothetical protein